MRVAAQLTLATLVLAAAAFVLATVPMAFAF
jgi:hypothetical protein